MPVPVGQDVRGDEVDGGGELPGWSLQTVQISPVVTGTGLIALDALDDLDELVDRLVRPQRGLVADHDRVDVAVAAGERDGGLDFPLVAASFLSIQMPSVTLSPNSAAIAGTSSPPPVDV